MNELVKIKNNQVVVSSRQVAEKFGKLHKDVLENIRNILAGKIPPLNFIRKLPTNTADKNSQNTL